MGKIANFVKQFLAPVDNRGGWWPWVREPFTGAWQNNEEWKADDVSAYFAVYACMTLISSDIAKMAPQYQGQDSDGIWVNIKDPAITNLLKRPNGYQNHIQFKQWWIQSKLFRGNTYALKYRGRNNKVERLYILDPDLVTVLVAPGGEVFYQLNQDNLSGVEESTITVPATEIIHDRMCCLFHPLVGVSPLYAAGLAASQGLKIQNDSSRFFANGARPGGILTAPGSISQETADRLKAHWETNYSGSNAGKVAVVGDNLKFESLRMTASDAQIIEQLEWTATVVCSAYHVPPYKIGVGGVPPNNNVEALTTEYYTQCLQILIEEFELCLAEGLDLTDGYRLQLDLDALFRMDSSSQVKMLVEGIKGGLWTPNEGRKRVNYKPITGGDTVYMQEQNYSLEALSKRDSREDPFAKSDSTTSTTPAADTNSADDQEIEAQARAFGAMLEKELRSALSC
jgi:HK97 family phage portal protein